ncbi:hypothetical protein LCGC14_1016060 [marine sediment metagenome]|uniref:Uncharacterized protein n=1 Tax=marine sediment metagenome TaxID=412755 RepID=A0A0F9NKF2_9ZZZZ
MKTRDEEIAGGLERGTLVGKNKCGCVIIQDRTADAYIVYCPKHKSAPDLYEALKALVAFDDTGGDGVSDHYILIRNAKEALAKADGGK